MQQSFWLADCVLNILTNEINYSIVLSCPLKVFEGLSTVLFLQFLKISFWHQCISQTPSHRVDPHLQLHVTNLGPMRLTSSWLRWNILAMHKRTESLKSEPKASSRCRGEIEPTSPHAGQQHWHTSTIIYGGFVSLAWTSLCKMLANWYYNYMYNV